MMRWKHVGWFVLAFLLAWFGLNRLALAIAPPSTPEGQYGSWQTVGIDADFGWLELASPTSGWAVADRRDGTGCCDVFQSLMYQFDGNKWTWTQTLEGPRMIQMDLVSPTDAWLVANDFEMGTLAAGRVYHFTGAKWEPVTAPADRFLGLDMVSATDGYILGRSNLWRLSNGSIWQQVGPGIDEFFHPFSSALQVLGPQSMWYLSPGVYTFPQGYEEVLYSYNGVGWQISIQNPDLRAYAMYGPNDGWAVGDGGKMWRYNGTQWSPVASPTTADLISISLVGNDEAWALGENKTVLHFTGGVWQVATLPAEGRVIAMTGPSDGWIAGDNRWLRGQGGAWQEFVNDAQPTLNADSRPKDAVMFSASDLWTTDRHFDGYRWEPHQYVLDDSLFVTGSVSLTTRYGILSDLALASPTSGWALGDAGAENDGPDLMTRNLLYSFDGMQWTASTTPATEQELYVAGQGVDPSGAPLAPVAVTSSKPDAVDYGMLTGLSLVPPADLWVTASRGYVLRYSGSTWSTSRDAAMDGANPISLYAIDMLSAQDGWAVGNKIVHFDGTQWTTHPGPAQTLWAVDMLSPTLGVAVGEAGVIWHYNGTAWQAVTSPTDYNLSDVALLSSDEGWAVGWRESEQNNVLNPGTGVILYYDGKSWQVDAVLPRDPLRAIAVFDANSAFAVGDGVALALNRAPDRSQGTIGGRVTDEGGQPLAGIAVRAYRYAGTWFQAAAATTGQDGNYALQSIPVGIYRIFFSDTTGGHKSEYFDNQFSLTAASDVAVAANTTTGNIDAALAASPAPQIAVTGNVGSSVDPQTGQVTVLTSRTGSSSVTFSRVVTCTGGTAPSNVTLVVGGKTFPMTAGGGGMFTATLKVPGDLPNTTGPFALSVRYTCASPQEVAVGTIGYYDPSGTITDQAGRPVVGAVVNLYRVGGALPDSGGITGDCRTVQTRPGGATGSWSGLPPATVSSGTWLNPAVEQTMAVPSAAPNVNPQVTGADGRYGWDVVEGCWFVVVNAAGYKTQVSPVVGVPPAVTDLNLELEATTRNLFLPSIQR